MDQVIEQQIIQSYIDHGLSDVGGQNSEARLALALSLDMEEGKIEPSGLDRLQQLAQKMTDGEVKATLLSGIAETREIFFEALPKTADIFREYRMLETVLQSETDVERRVKILCTMVRGKFFGDKLKGIPIQRATENYAADIAMLTLNVGNEHDETTVERIDKLTPGFFADTWEEFDHTKSYLNDVRPETIPQNLKAMRAIAYGGYVEAGSNPMVTPSRMRDEYAQIKGMYGNMGDDQIIVNIHRWILEYHIHHEEWSPGYSR